MKRWIAVLAVTLGVVAATAAPAFANCRYFTITSGGRTQMCSECCYGGQCYVNCN